MRRLRRQLLLVLELLLLFLPLYSKLLVLLRCGCSHSSHFGRCVLSLATPSRLRQVPLQSKLLLVRCQKQLLQLLMVFDALEQ